jgi:hypothetical protein
MNIKNITRIFIYFIDDRKVLISLSILSIKSNMFLFILTVFFVNHSIWYGQLFFFFFVFFSIELLTSSMRKIVKKINWILLLWDFKNSYFDHFSIFQISLSVA